MSGMEVCKECGVPLLVGKEQHWATNGVITQASNPVGRTVFLESDNIDGLFAGIGRIAGVGIEDIIIESKARQVRASVESTLSPLARKAGRLVGTNMMVRRLSRTGRAYGYGDSNQVSRDKNDEGEETLAMSVRDPYSILLFCGENLGAWEAIQGRDHRVIREEVADSEYHVTNKVGSHPIELAGILKARRYAYKPGDVALERCPSCDVPRLAGQYTWDIENGTIRDPESGARMAIIDQAGLEATFDDLAAELGEAIPEAIVEAQRRNVREAMGERPWSIRTPTYRQMLAVRGLGNLRALEGNTERLALRIQNSCLAPMVAGMLQAHFELGARRMASVCRYELRADGDLDVEVTAL